MRSASSANRVAAVVAALLTVAALTVPATAAPPNDDFENAEDISATGVAVVSPAGGSVQPGERGCSFFDSSAWYRYVARDATPLSIGTKEPGAGTTMVGVYTGSDLATLEAVGCMSSGTFSARAAVHLFPEPGVPYYIQVGTRRSAASFALAVTPAAPGEVSGRVTRLSGAPVEGMCVRMVATTESVQTSTRADGTWRLAMPAGRYELFFHDCRGLGYGNRWWPGVRDFDESESVTVLPLERRSGFDVVTPALGTIRGRVTDEAGNPAGQTCVAGWPSEGLVGDEHAWVGEDGLYALSRLEPDTYRVKFYDCRDEPRLTGEWWNDKPTASQADVITIAEGQHVTGVDAALAALP